MSEVGLSATTASSVSADAELPPPPASSPHSPEDETARPKGKYRFEVTALSLATMILAVCVLQSLATSEFLVVRLAVLPCALFLTFFGYEWVIYFSDGLTRRKRAYFDVRNVLETYQPRRNTDMARLFKPDPPTPSVSTQPPKGTRADGDVNAAGKEGGDHKQQGDGANKSKKDFAAWRREHYDNEYAVAMQARAGETRLYDPINEGGSVEGNAAGAEPSEGSATPVAVDSVADLQKKLKEQKEAAAAASSAAASAEKQQTTVTPASSQEKTGGTAEPKAPEAEKKSEQAPAGK